MIAHHVTERCDGRGPALCGCYDCDEEVWNRMAGNFTCLGRILALLVEDDPDTRRRYTEEKACTVVSNEFMDICGPACHPKKVRIDIKAVYFRHRSIHSLTHILSLKCDDQPRYCGCQNCTLEVWNTTAGRGATCGSRILYLQTFDGGDLTEEEACAQVSREVCRCYLFVVELYYVHKSRKNAHEKVVALAVPSRVWFRL